MSDNIYPIDFLISREERFKNLSYKPGVLWLTGLSGSGKSTLAKNLDLKLQAEGVHSYILDGDNLRNRLCSDLGFTMEARRENIRRVAEVARLLADAGVFVITSFISPTNEIRKMAQELIKPFEFIEVYAKADLAVCEKRDPKGLYKKARSGELKNFTGIDSKFEEPLGAEIVIDTGVTSLEDSVSSLISYLKNNQIIKENKRRAA